MSAETISEAGEAITDIASAIEAAAAWHDQRRRDTPDAFEMEFHEVSAAAIRSLTARVAVAPEAADPAVEGTPEICEALEFAKRLIGAGNDNLNEAQRQSNVNQAWHILDGVLKAAALARSVGPDLRGVVEKASAAVVTECYRKLKKLANEQGPDFAKEAHMLGVAAGYLLETQEDIVARALGEAR